MKKHLIAFLLLANGVSNYCIAQNDAQINVHTFTVDGELPPPTKEKSLINGNKIAMYYTVTRHHLDGYQPRIQPLCEPQP